MGMKRLLIVVMFMFVSSFIFADNLGWNNLPPKTSTFPCVDMAYLGVKMVDRTRKFKCEIRMDGYIDNQKTPTSIGGR